MEIAIERALLLNGLAMVQGIVERRNTVPILGHALLELSGTDLVLAATDLEVGIRTAIACKSCTGNSITLNARKLFEIVREAAGDEVEIKSLDNDWVEIKCGRARFKMMGLDPRQFPAMPRQGEPKPATAAGHNAVKAELAIEASVLAGMIDKTIFAVSPDETRYNLSGVYVESPDPGAVVMAATDGHRLSMIRCDAKGFEMQGGAIIPRKGLAELRKLIEGEGEVKLSLDGQLAWLKRGPTEVSMRLVEGEFPDYRGVIPRQSRHQIRIDRDELLDAVKRAAIFSNERFHGVKFAFANGALTVSSTSPDLGEASETLDVEFRGEELSVGFNAMYLIQALSIIPGGNEVVLGVTDESSAGVLETPADAGYTYVIMPMRL